MTKSNKFENWSIERQFTKIRIFHINELKKRGFAVREITPKQFRINESLDLYPQAGRFHDLKTNTRGEYPAYCHGDYRSLMELERAEKLIKQLE